MSAVETVARRWHEGTDHAADGAAFGSPTCNCLTVAGRIVPMLADAWRQGVIQGHDECTEGPECWTNPYEADR